MGGYPEGAPCWADVALSDVSAGKRFYGELLGWTFDEAGDEQGQGQGQGQGHGNGHGPGRGQSQGQGQGQRSGQRYGRYVNAYRQGRRVAALHPKQDGRMPTTWTVYFATPDIRALAARVREAGGQVITDPVPVPPLGTMAVAADPGGAVFGLWQADAHAGFERTREPGSFCWAEVYTRDKNQADAFYESVFGYLGASPGSAEELGADMRTWSLPGTEPGPGTAVAARALMSPAFPAALPDHFLLYFLVEDCDAAADACARLGGRVTAAPFDIQYGRMAVLNDNQGATFAVLQGADT